MNKFKFKKGDTVYWGTLKGNIFEIDGHSTFPLKVNFNDNSSESFTIGGSVVINTQQVLFHEPYELNFIKPKIEKDTVVYYRDKEEEEWRVGYYSHFEDGQHFIFDDSKKSIDSEEFDVMGWNIVTTENPLT